MNMFKKNGGFTLVELIVVIAILAILAAVAVPAYSGYITKANDAADITALGSVKTAALAAAATKGEVKSITVTTTNDVITEISAVVKTGEKTESGKTTDVTETAVLYKVENSTATWATGDYEDFKMFINSTIPTLKGELKAGATWTAETAEWVGADETPAETTAPAT